MTYFVGAVGAMGEGKDIADETRRLARERAPNAESFLEILDHGHYPDRESVQMLAAERDRLLPALRGAVRERGGAAQLSFARALVAFDDRLGWDILSEALRSNDLAMRRGALQAMTWADIRRHMLTRSLPIEADVLLAALESSLADSDRWNGEQAVRIIGYLGTPAALDRLVALLDDPRPEMRTAAAIELGDAGLDRGGLAVIESMLQVPKHPKSYFLIRVLERLCESADPDIRTRAAVAASDFINASVAHRDGTAAEANVVANDIWHCMDGIAAACDLERREALHQRLRQVCRNVLDSKLVWWIRGMALKRLAALDGQDGIARLIEALSDSDLRKDALEGLSSLAAGSDDPIVLEALRKELRNGDALQLSTLVKTFLNVGGKAKALAQDVISRLDPDVAMTVNWLIRDIGPREAAAKLRPAFGQIAPSDTLLAELDAQWRADPVATRVIWRLLGEWRRIVAAVYKTVNAEVDHSETVRDLAAIAGKRFPVDEVVQTGGHDGDFRVMLVHEGCGYSFPVQDHGRWCNVPAVINGLNGVLDRLGLSERFIELDSGTSDVALVTFACADIFMPLAQELGIRLGRAAT